MSGPTQGVGLEADLSRFSRTPRAISISASPKAGLRWFSIVIVLGQPPCRFVGAGCGPWRRQSPAWWPMEVRDLAQSLGYGLHFASYGLHFT